MRDLGPWSAHRPIAVAVSGGADSLALAFLIRNWSPFSPLALVVDHRLRASSAGEAAVTRATLARLGVPSRLLLLDLPAGPRLQERARRARHAALADACAQAGLLDLALGHQGADQTETVRMRARAGSGPDGLAGMARISERNHLRLLRPLLGMSPPRLRATLRLAGLPWVEDPSNRDPRFERARLRADPGPTPCTPASTRERDAAWLARHVTLHEAGFAILPPGPVPSSALSRLLQTLSGHEHPPGRAETERLAQDPHPATLHGVRLLAAGRLGKGLIACREPAAMARPVLATPGAIWDNRFRLGQGAVPLTWTMGALGQHRCKATSLPSAVLRSLPALYDENGTLQAAPLAGIHHLLHEIDVMFAPLLPIAPSFFTSPCHPSSMTDHRLPCACLAP